MTALKLVFAGSLGTETATAIRAISEIKPLPAEVRPLDHRHLDNGWTPVAMDHGMLTLGDGRTLHLYGTPAGLRFDFPGPIIAQGALGAVLLMDNSRPDPLADLAVCLQAFQSLAVAGAVAIGVGRMNHHPRPALDDYAGALARLRIVAPVLPLDPRDRRDVLRLLQVLFRQIEAMNGDGGTAGPAASAQGPP